MYGYNNTVSNLKLEISEERCKSATNVLSMLCKKHFTIFYPDFRVICDNYFFIIFNDVCIIYQDLRTQEILEYTLFLTPHTMELILTHIDVAYVIHYSQNIICSTTYIMSYKVNDDANIINFDEARLNRSGTTLKKQFFVNATSLSMLVSLNKVCRNMSLQHLVITFNVTKPPYTPLYRLGFRKNTRSREAELMIRFSAQIELKISSTYTLELTSPLTKFSNTTFVSYVYLFCKSMCEVHETAVIQRWASNTDKDTRQIVIASLNFEKTMIYSCGQVENYVFRRNLLTANPTIVLMFNTIMSTIPKHGVKKLNRKTFQV